MKKTFTLSFILILSLSIFSQSPQTWTSADVYLAIRKLNVLGSVLYVAAHPDDENTRLIAYLSKDKLYRTGYLSMTRGDGGQNLIGDEQDADGHDGGAGKKQPAGTDAVGEPPGDGRANQDHE